MNYEGWTFQRLIRERVPRDQWPAKARTAFSRWNSAADKTTAWHRRRDSQQAKTYWKAIDRGEQKAPGVAGLSAGRSRLEMIKQRATRGLVP